jgi:glycosyltransferase involved in cell wall biosynthesis
MEIKISIIIPVYNVEKYLADCLESIVNQTLKDIEIICVNNGSTDSSGLILKEFAKRDSRIKIINQENSGPSSARNSGLNIAKGEYVGFVDSDDWVDNDFFEKLYNVSKKYDSDVAAGGFYREIKQGKHEKIIKYRKEKLFVKSEDKIKQAQIPIHNYVWNKIYKRESLFKLNLPFEDGKFFEDILWSVKVIYALDGFVTVPNTYYHYRMNEGSIVTQKSKKHMKDYLYAEKDMLDFIKSNDIKILAPYKKPNQEKIFFCGIEILKKSYYYPDTVKYRLFGFIPILTIKKY